MAEPVSQIVAGVVLAASIVSMLALMRGSNGWQFPRLTLPWGWVLSIHVLVSLAAGAYLTLTVEWWWRVALPATLVLAVVMVWQDVRLDALLRRMSSRRN